MKDYSINKQLSPYSSRIIFNILDNVNNKQAVNTQQVLEKI
jgi:hypothetical protein